MQPVTRDSSLALLYSKISITAEGGCIEKLLSLFDLRLAAAAPNAPAEEQAWDLQGNTVMRLWDSPNPYDPEVTEVDRKMAAVLKPPKRSNVNFEFYSTSTQWDGCPMNGFWRGTGTFLAHHQQLLCHVGHAMVANDALQDVKTGLDTLKIPQPLKDMAVFSG